MSPCLGLAILWDIDNLQQVSENSWALVLIHLKIVKWPLKVLHSYLHHKMLLVEEGLQQKQNNEKGLQFQEVFESLICLELEGANDNKMWIC